MASAASVGGLSYAEINYRRRAAQRENPSALIRPTMYQRIREMIPQPYQAEAQAGTQRDNLIDAILSTEFDPRSLDTLKQEQKVKYNFEMKTRAQHMQKLQDQNVEFDLLIVGGGANGTGVVLDAASRGLNCAVIDSYDFAAGTSSRSTKMAHGGIRYFQ